MSICANNELFSFRTFPSPQRTQSAIRYPLRIRLKKPNSYSSLKRMIRQQTASQSSSAPSVWSCCPLTEAPRTTQCSRPLHKYISGFLSARRPSQCISGLLLLSHNHIIVAAPCHSIHALHTLETLVACFLSRGPGLMYHLVH